MRLLLLDDDKLLRESACMRLRDDGHLVETFERLSDVRLVQCDAYDVLLVSWQLPDGSGLSWVGTLRKQGVGTATLVLSEAHRLTDRIKTALEAGADDCMVKPVDIDVLAARVRELRYRVAGLTTPQLHYGDVELDLENRTTFRGGERVSLTAREWGLVEALALRFDRIVSKAELTLLVLGINAQPASTALEVHLSNVRRKLGRGLIRTVRGAGLRMAA
jgi:two-component system OmpR family response regulator